MNPIDHQLNRLFRAASVAPSDQVATPPYGLETRVLAAGRAPGSFEAVMPFWDTTLLVRGLILAALIMIISLWPVVNRTADPFSEYLQLADSSLPADNAP